MVEIVIDKLREQHEAIRLQHEMTLLQAETAAVSALAFPGMHVGEAQQMREGWGDMVSQQEYPSGRWDHSQSYGGLLWNTIGADIGDRALGAEQQVFQNEIDLARIRAIGRLLGNSSANAQAVLTNLTSYILGVGYAYKAVAEEGESPTEALLQGVQKVIAEFRRENQWWDREEDLFKRVHRDGEFFVPLYHTGNGHVQMRVLEPEQCTEPDDPDTVLRELGMADRALSWSFGVLTDDDDVENVYGYWFRWKTPEGRDSSRFIPESEVVHCKRNVDENIKRGVSDFYAVYEQLLDAGKLLRNTTKGHAIMAAIAFIREHAEGVTQAQAESMRSTGAWSRYRETTGTEGARTRYTHHFAPGTIVDTGHNTKYLASPMASQGVGLAMVNVEESVLRIVGSKWSMPAFMITGNISEAAYSSTLAAESPFTKFCEREQIKHGDNYTQILWAVLRIAHAAGRFDKFRLAFEDLRRRVKIEVKQPIVPQRDRNIETNRHKLLRDSGIIADETWAAEEGYDHEREKKRGAKEHKIEAPFAGGDQPGQSVQKSKPDKGKAEGSLREHMGPGSHPSGSDQDVHGDGGGVATGGPKRKVTKKLAAHEMTRAEYENEISQIKPLPNKMFKASGTLILQNPSYSDVQVMMQDVRREFPRMPVGEPKVRTTRDKRGNEWTWKAHEGTHLQIEPTISRRVGVDVDQNYEIPRHSDLVRKAIREKQPIPKHVQAEYPRWKEYFRYKSPKASESRLHEAAALLWGDYPGTGGAESVTEHHGPGDHPSGSPQEVHGVGGGEAKFQKIKKEKGAAAAKAAIKKEAGAGGAATTEPSKQSGKKVSGKSKAERSTTSAQDAVARARESEAAIVDKIATGTAALDPKLAGKYEKSAINVVSAMGPKAVQDFNAGLSDVSFHADVTTLNTAVNTQYDMELGPNDRVAGAFNDRTGELHLDGGKGGPGMQRESIYAHEFSHVVDRGGKHSATSAWYMAWKSEIKTGGLTEYASSSFSEGFAEFGRLAWATSPDVQEAVARKFPKCTAFWKREGLGF